MEIDKADAELVELYPGLKRPGGWISSEDEFHIIRNMDAQHIRHVMKELNKLFKKYCTRNKDGEFVGVSAELIKNKLAELQEALPNDEIVISLRRVNDSNEL